MQYKTIDLCAGIGGIRRGFELAGDFKTVASAEIDEQACRTYEHLHGDNPRNDITSSKFKQHLKTLRYDVLMAGFPCQTFSSVGLRQGFKDKIKGIGCNVQGAATTTVTPDNDVIEGAVSALIMLGFPSAATNKVVQAIVKSEPTATIEQVIKLALKQL